MTAITRAVGNHVLGFTNALRQGSGGLTCPSMNYFLSRHSRRSAQKVAKTQTIVRLVTRTGFLESCNTGTRTAKSVSDGSNNSKVCPLCVNFEYGLARPMPPASGRPSGASRVHGAPWFIPRRGDPYRFSRTNTGTRSLDAALRVAASSCPSV